MVAHSIPLVSLGAFILIFGFFAFNGGSQASITSPGDGEAVSRAVVNTLVSCCVAGTTVLFLNKVVPGGKWSLLKVINGCLIGLFHYNPSHLNSGLCDRDGLSLCRV